MKKLTYVLIVVVMVAMAFFWVGSNKKDNSDTATLPSGARGDTLNVVVADDPAHLDSNDSDSQVHFQVVRNIYETLFVYDENYEIKPWLCESYEYQGDDALIIKLRRGVKFHNGDELKASDVHFTIKRVHDNKLGAMVEFGNILVDKCEILDDYTYKMVTNGPIATQIALMENPAAAILSQRAYEEAKGDFLNGAAVGTGPFVFDKYAAGDHIVLKAFDDYWREGEPHFDTMVMRFISDAASRAIEAETGGADIILDIGAKHRDTVSKAKDMTLVSSLGTNTSHLLMNIAKAPLDNDLVRQAIWYGVDAPAAVKLAYGDFGSFAQDWVSPGIKGANSNLAAEYFPKRDIEKAKKCLAEAGYANGLTLEITAPSSNQERADMAEAFQAQLKEVGITVNVNVMEMNAWIDHILSGKGQLTIYGFSAADFEADRALVQFMPSSVNYAICAYDNSEFQATVAKSFVTMDADKRYELYQKAIIMLVKDHVTIPLWHKELNAAIKKDIKGFSLTRSYENHYFQYVHR